MNHEHGTRYVRVIVDRAIHRELDYSLPENLAVRVGVGSRVRVPFRDKSALATVVAIPEQSEAKGIRPIEAIIGDAPVLSEQLLELARWIGTYYCCPIETVMRSMLPQVIRRAEVGWKKQLFVQPARSINPVKSKKLRDARRGRPNFWRRFRSWKTDTRGGAPAANLAR
jgi:Primosomal protein N'' (replication factor Y) - superfamily II helicase